MVEKPIVTPARMNRIFKGAASSRNRGPWYCLISERVGKLIFKGVGVPISHRPLLTELLVHLHQSIHLEGAQRRRERLETSDVLTLFKSQVDLARRLHAVFQTPFSAQAVHHADYIERTLLPLLERGRSPAVLQEMLSERTHNKPFPDIVREMLVTGLHQTLSAEKMDLFWKEYKTALDLLARHEDIRRQALKDGGSRFI